MEHTANPTLRQGQEYMYECVTFLFSYLRTIDGLSERDQIRATTVLFDALQIVLKATASDNARDDKDFQRFKRALIKKPRKNSELAKSLAA